MVSRRTIGSNPPSCAMRNKKIILDELNKERSRLAEMTRPKMDKRPSICTIDRVREQQMIVDELIDEYNNANKEEHM